MNVGWGQYASDKDDRVPSSDAIDSKDVQEAAWAFPGDMASDKCFRFWKLWMTRGTIPRPALDKSSLSLSASQASGVSATLVSGSGGLNALLATVLVIKSLSSAFKLVQSPTPLPKSRRCTSSRSSWTCCSSSRNKTLRG